MSRRLFLDLLQTNLDLAISYGHISISEVGNIMHIITKLE